MFRHMLICILCEDFSFYMSHRLLHIKDKRLPLYQWIHKTHHEFMHPISIAGENSHPIEFAFGNHYTAFTGLFLLGSRCHFWTLMWWGVGRMVDAHDIHCGYDFPWSVFQLLPFGTDSTYHNFHHTKNIGNYASQMTIWDTIFNSNSEYYKVMKEGARDESEEA